MRMGKERLSICVESCFLGVLVLLSLSAHAIAQEQRYRGRTFMEWQGDLKASAPEIRKRAIKTLGDFGAQAIHVIAPFMGDSEFEVRDAATDILGKLGPEVVPAMIIALADSNYLIRGNAANVLGQIGPEAKDAVPALEGALKDMDVVAVGPRKGHKIRVHAIRALGKIGLAAQAAVPALTEASRDSDPEVREEALEALRAILNSEDTDSAILFRAHNKEYAHIDVPYCFGVKQLSVRYQFDSEDWVTELWSVKDSYGGIYHGPDSGKSVCVYATLISLNPDRFFKQAMDSSKLTFSFQREKRDYVATFDDLQARDIHGDGSPHFRTGKPMVLIATPIKVKGEVVYEGNGLVCIKNCELVVEYAGCVDNDGVPVRFFGSEYSCFASPMRVLTHMCENCDEKKIAEINDAGVCRAHCALKKKLRPPDYTTKDTSDFMVGLASLFLMLAIDAVEVNSIGAGVVAGARLVRIGLPKGGFEFVDTALNNRVAVNPSSFSSNRMAFRSAARKLAGMAESGVRDGYATAK